MKRRNFLFSLILILLFLSVGMITIFKTQDDVSLRENKKLARFKKPTVSSVIDASFQNNFESAFSDQFIGKIHLYDAYTALNNVLRSTVNSANSDDLALVSISDKGVYSIGVGGDWLMEFPWVKSNDMDELIASRIYNYNDIASVHPELDFYIYKVTNLRDVDWFDESNDFVSAGFYYESWFKRDLDPAYEYRSSSFTSLDEYKEYNYRTDHHWNADGARQGYIELIEMISKKHPEIGGACEPLSKETSPIHFFGSMAKTSNYNIPDDNYDLISDYLYDLPEHSVYVNGEKVDHYGNIDAYLAGDVEDSKEVNDYREMFGADTYMVEYDYGNNTGVNIVVISDSYSNCIESVFASHFDHCYFVDLRQERDEDFNLKRFAQEKDIDIVLYMGSFFDMFMERAFALSLY